MYQPYDDKKRGREERRKLEAANLPSSGILFSVFSGVEACCVLMIVRVRIAERRGWVGT